MIDASTEKSILKEISPPYGTPKGSIDLSVLRDSLDKTVWERMQANDDALNFAMSLREAMERRNAKLE